MSVRWKKWKRSFKLYLTGKGVTVDSQKRALLLHAAGVGVQEIYFTLVNEERYLLSDVESSRLLLHSESECTVRKAFV